MEQLALSLTARGSPPKASAPLPVWSIGGLGDISEGSLREDPHGQHLPAPPRTFSCSALQMVGPYSPLGAPPWSGPALCFQEVAAPSRKPDLPF